MATVTQETTALSTLLQGWAKSHGYLDALEKLVPEDVDKRRAEVEKYVEDRFLSTLQQNHPDIIYGLSDYNIRVTLGATAGVLNEEQRAYTVVPYLERKQR